MRLVDRPSCFSTTERLNLKPLQDFVSSTSVFINVEARQLYWHLHCNFRYTNRWKSYASKLFATFPDLSTPFFMSSQWILKLMKTTNQRIHSDECAMEFDFNTHTTSIRRSCLWNARWAPPTKFGCRISSVTRGWFVDNAFYYDSFEVSWMWLSESYWTQYWRPFSAKRHDIFRGDRFRPLTPQNIITLSRANMQWRPQTLDWNFRWCRVSPPHLALSLFLTILQVPRPKRRSWQG